MKSGRKCLRKVFIKINIDECLPPKVKKEERGYEAGIVGPIIQGKAKKMRRLQKLNK